MYINIYICQEIALALILSPRELVMLTVPPILRSLIILYYEIEYEFNFIKK